MAPHQVLPHSPTPTSQREGRAQNMRSPLIKKCCETGTERGQNKGRGCPGGGRTRGNKLSCSSPAPEVTAAPLAGRYWVQPVKQQSQGRTSSQGSPQPCSTANLVGRGMQGISLTSKDLELLSQVLHGGCNRERHEQVLQTDRHRSLYPCPRGEPPSLAT